MSFVLNKTYFGRYVYALGGNKEAARLAGININRMKYRIAMIEGFYIGLAVILLIGRLGSGGIDSWSSFKFVPGPFTEAFEKGYVLLLDEVNLAPNPVLQCMLSALDSDEITQSVPGIGLKTFN